VVLGVGSVLFIVVCLRARTIYHLNIAYNYSTVETTTKVPLPSNHIPCSNQFAIGLQYYAFNSFDLGRVKERGALLARACALLATKRDRVDFGPRSAPAALICAQVVVHRSLQTSNLQRLYFVVVCCGQKCQLNVKANGSATTLPTPILISLFPQTHV
jgi:hypothetical protein